MDRAEHDRAGLATRVADAQRQAGGTLRLAVAFVVASPLAALVPHDTGAWLPLHLFLVGGVLLAIAAATQLLAVTWSTAPAPDDRLVTAQRSLLAAGAIAVAAGRELDADAVVAGGGVAVGVGIVALLVGLVQIRRRATVDRFHAAIEAYVAAACWALIGVGLGVAVAVIDSTAGWLRLRDAHPAVNLLGLAGLIIIGTLPYFVATQARTRMSPRASPRTVRLIVGAANAAVAVAVIGHLTDTGWVTALGYGTYAVAVVATVGIVPHIGPRQLRWAGPRLAQLGAGVAWWIVSTVLLGVAELNGDAVDVLGVGLARSDILAALVVGGLAQILVASLAYFGPVLRGGGHEHLTAGFATTRSPVSLVVANVAAVALLVGATRVGAVFLVAWAVDVGVRAVRLALPARPRAG